MGDSKSRASLDSAVPSKATTASQIRPLRPVAFGRYELLGRLRLGGMAELFRARERESGRIVAIKRILPSFTDEADYLAMFADEARLAQRLKHPGIVEAFEIGRVDGELFIALEYVHGHDLGAVLGRARELKQPLPVKIACRIALEVCSALEYAHALRDERGVPLGIVHRDVSPQNLLVSYDGDVKLIDFGIAKSSDQLMRTQAGLLKGKHGYLSPEQARGAELDHRSDVFSLGICLYEMLSAQRLFQGGSDFSTLARVRNSVVPPLRQSNPNVPERLATIVQRALSAEPALRFDAAAGMGRALARFAKETREQCDRGELAQFVRDCFPAGIDPAATAAAEADPSTGLLDAFEGLEPPSQLSALVSAEAAAELEEPLREGKRASQEYDSPFEREEPTRVVNYGSPMDHTENAAPTLVARMPHASHAPGGRKATPSELTRSRRQRPTGSGPLRSPTTLREWEPEDEQQTQVYEPSVSAEPVPAREPQRLYTPALRPRVDTLRPRAISRPMLAPAPLQMPMQVAATIPTRPPRVTPLAPHSMAPSVAPRPGSRDLATRLLASVVVVLLGIAGSIWLTRGAEAGGLRMTTDPMDVTLRIDGVAMGERQSPFLISNLKANVTHELDISKTGYRSWHTTLVLQPGQELALSHVRLLRDGVPAVPAPRTARAPIAAPVVTPSAVPAPRAPQPPAAVPMLKAVTKSTATARSARPVHSAWRAPPARKAQAQPARGARPVPAAAGTGTATLRVNSRPWSRVYVDGRLVGSTPQMNLILSAGGHNLTLVNPDFNLRKVLTLQLKPGEVVTKAVTLDE